jgi:hypothetical protein
MKYPYLIFFLAVLFIGCKDKKDSQLNLLKKWYFEDRQTQLPYLMSLSNVDTIYKVISKGGLNDNKVGDTAEILTKSVHEDSVIVNQEIKSIMCCKNKFAFVDRLKKYTSILTDSENEYLNFYSKINSDTIIKTKGYFYYNLDEKKATDSVVTDTSFSEVLLLENNQIVKKYIQFEDSTFINQTEYYYDFNGSIDSMVSISKSLFENHFETSVFDKNNDELVQVNKYCKTENWMTLNKDTVVNQYGINTIYKNNFPFKEFWKRENGDTATIVEFIIK